MSNDGRDPATLNEIADVVIDVSTELYGEGWVDFGLRYGIAERLWDMGYRSVRPPLSDWVVNGVRWTQRQREEFESFRDQARASGGVVADYPIGFSRERSKGKDD